MPFVLIFEHRFGKDVYVAHTREAIEKQREYLAHQWRDEYDIPEEIPDAVLAESWCEYTHGTEGFEIRDIDFVEEAPDGVTD